jgi:DNA polymerase I-like protein with 3'-5' exonuclease and polymerase domains
MSWIDALEEATRPKIERKPWMDDVRMELVSPDQIVSVVDECIESGLYALDLETTGLDTRVFNGETQAKIVGICLSPNPDVGYYIPVRHRDSDANVPWMTVVREMVRLTSSDARAVFHNAKFDQPFLQFNGTQPFGDWNDHKKWEDTLILAYLRNSRERRKGLKHLSKADLGLEMIELAELWSKPGESMDFSTLDPEWEPVVWYAASDAICTLRLYNLLSNTPAVKAQAGVYSIEKMCLTATRWMEGARIPTNQVKVAELIKVGQREWWDALGQVYAEAGGILGRDVRPGWVRMMAGEVASGTLFDPDELSPSYMEKVNVSRRFALKQGLDPKTKFLKTVPVLKLSAPGPKPANGRTEEEVGFPTVYDVLAPEQLGSMLRELGAPGLKATEKSGQVKTSKDELDRVLEEAGERVPFAGLIKRFREIAKALSTYLLPLAEDCAHDGTIKANFNGLKADTGRFTCPTSRRPKIDGGSRIPLQGMPSTYDPSAPECSRRIRECITAREGRVLVAIDYAGVELRLATNLSGEPRWMEEYFRCSDCGQGFSKGDGKSTPQAPSKFCPECGSDRIGDLHSLTGSMLYGEDARKDKKAWKQKRQIAKQVNFLLCYGGSGNAVCRSTGVPEVEGRRIKDQFDRNYPTLRSWWDRQHDFARKNEYVLTAFGRRYPVPDVNMPKFDKLTGRRNGNFIAKAERNSVNGPIQGTSADITKLAMGLIHKAVRKNGWLDKMDMILTMHDELVFDVHPSILVAFLDQIPNIMASNPVVLSRKWPIPLTVDVEIGGDWTVPFDLAEIQRDGEVPDELRKLLGDEVSAALVGSPPPTALEGAPPAPENDTGKIPILTHVLVDIDVNAAFRLADAIHASADAGGSILKLAGSGVSEIEEILWGATAGPRVNPDMFKARIKGSVSYE